MTRRSTVLLFMAVAVMELSWLGAWAGFSALAMMGRLFPLLAGCVVFLLGALVTRLIRGRAWRRLSIALFHGCAIGCSTFLLLDVLYERPHLFPVLPQLREFVAGPRSSSEWLILAVNACWAFLFYWRGVKLAGRNRDYYGVCRRFDLGLAAFFMLFVTRLLLVTKGGIRVDDTGALLLVFPFFLFSLMAIGLTRTRQQVQKSFLPGYGALGVIFSFASLVLLSAAGLILFFLPGLTATARAGVNAVKPAGSAFASLFLWAIRFLYVPKQTRPEPAGSFGMKWEALTHVKGGWWSEVIAKIMAWGLGGLAVLVMLTLFVMLLFFFVRWLLSRTPAARQEGEPRHKSDWLTALKALLLSLMARIARSIKGYERASELFAALAAWGRRSGLAHEPSETPGEFAVRLQRRFPLLHRDIGSIVTVFHEEVYGERLLAPAELRAARSAWSRLRRPRHWPARLKSRLRVASGSRFDSVSAP